LELLLLKAVAAHRMGDASSSGEQMRRAVALYGHTGLLRPFATIDRSDLDRLLTRAGVTLDPADLDVLDAHDSPFPSTLTLVRLTPRERELARALSSTASRQQIADELYVSLNTVRTQLATLYRKLGVRTREDALTRLASLGLLTSWPARRDGSDPRAAS
jgi:LuxR family maltose regulon positive regulatory protein